MTVPSDAPTHATPGAAASGGRLSDGRRRQERIICAGVWLAMCGAIALLTWRAPSEIPALPECEFHRLTGLYCPGCGATRAVYLFLHGHVAQAIGANPMLAIVFPFLGWALLAFTFQAVTGRRVAGPRPSALWIRLFLVVLMLFWLLRNIPVYPLTLLAP